jgi:Na+-driven multidrug efflux pump
MNPNDRPLSSAERQQLREIRERRANRNARREIANDQYFKGAGKSIFAFFAGALLLFWPLLVWHGPLNEAGHYTWDKATWIAITIWWACVGIIGLVYWRTVWQRRKS